MSFAGSGPLFAEEEYTKLNLCNELTRFGLADYSSKTDIAPQVAETVLLGDVKEELTKICSIKTGKNLKAARNAFVGYVMGLSDLRCGVYKQEVLRKRAVFARATLSLATLFAGAGAVLSHAPTAKAFSAASGAASGINAVDAQEKFANLTIEVITAGIDQRRGELRKSALERYKKNMEMYTVGDAVKDVMAYHAACTAVTGLEIAKESITRLDDPGILKFFETIGELRKNGVDVAIGNNGGRNGGDGGDGLDNGGDGDDADNGGDGADGADDGGDGQQ